MWCERSLSILFFAARECWEYNSNDEFLPSITANVVISRRIMNIPPWYENYGKYAIAVLSSCIEENPS